MQTGGQRLHRLLESGKVPIRGGVWLDAYNQAVSYIAGTITVGVSDRCQTFVTIMTDEKDNAP